MSEIRTQIDSLIHGLRGARQAEEVDACINNMVVEVSVLAQRLHREALTDCREALVAEIIRTASRHTRALARLARPDIAKGNVIPFSSQHVLGDSQ